MAPKELTDQELLELVEEAFNEAFEIIYSEDGWKEEKKNDKGDVVVSKKSKKGKRIYRITAIIDCDAEKLIKKLKDTSDLTSWNKTLTKHEVVREVTDDVCITYQVTAAAGPADIVSARDFVLVMKAGHKDEIYVRAGCSIEHPSRPEDQAKVVRAWNGPTGITIKSLPDGKCEFRWLMDCDYRGMIPTTVMEMAMPIAAMEFAQCHRELAATL